MLHPKGSSELLRLTRYIIDIPMDPSQFPTELRQSSRWVNWKLETSGDRPNCKVPYDGKTGHRAQVTNPDHWSSLEEVMARDPEHIGLVIDRPYLAVDIDKVRNPETGECEDWAYELIQKLNTYTELSPSGKGYHLWLRGEAPVGKEGVRTTKLEVYFRGRYFTVTGQPVSVRSFVSPDDVRALTGDQVAELLRFVEGRRAGPSKTPTAQPTGSEKLQHYLTSIDFPDLSAAVHSLLVQLAIVTICDPAQMEERFKTSALYRETHWGEKWSRLKESELSKALSSGRDFYQKRKNQYKQALEPPTYSLVVKRGGKREALRFLWEPYLPQGKLVHFGGASSQGKSPVTVDLIARLTRGLDWPNDQKNPLGPRSAILLNVEDNYEDTILPRLDVAGGDDQLLHYVKGTRCEQGDKKADLMVALDRDVFLLAELARSIPDLSLVIIDPITNYLGKVKMNAEEEVRSILSPLAQLAEDLKVTVVTVGHFNRRERGTDPLFRMMGAAAFGGMARAVYAFGPNPTEESPYHHVITPARGSLGDGGLAYHTSIEEVTFENLVSKVVKVNWDGKVAATAEDAVDPISRRDKSAIIQAAALVREFLKDGRRPTGEVQGFLKSNGFNPEQLNVSRILQQAGARSFQEKRHWWWELVKNEEVLF